MDQSKAGISRLRAWVLGQKKDYLSKEDIVISASVDEILSPDTLIRWGRITAFLNNNFSLFRLKSCGVYEDVSFGGLWMPFGDLTKVIYEHILMTSLRQL